MLCVDVVEVVVVVVVLVVVVVVDDDDDNVLVAAVVVEPCQNQSQNSKSVQNLNRHYADRL